jgi:ribonuclease Z
MKHNAPCLAYSFVEKDKIRLDKQKLEKLKIKGKIIAELAKGKNIIWQGKKIQADKLAYKEKGKKITFIFDTGINSNAVKIAKNSDLLIEESTFLDNSENGKNLAKEYKHLTAKLAALIAKKAKVKRLILTHLSQRYENKENLILQEAKKIFKNSSLAEDLDKVEV